MSALKFICKKRISAFAFILFHFYTNAQINCDNDTTFLVPIVDLQTGTYFGKQGGLYPGGSNEMPVDHANAGLAIANNIMPLNNSGIADTVFGKLAMIALGSTDAGKSFNKFLDSYTTAGYGDTCFKIVNACFESYGLNDMIDTSSTNNYWSDVKSKLQDNDVKVKQVQVAWLMSNSFSDLPIELDAYVDTMQKRYTDVIRKLKKEFINLKIVYISGMHYGGYISPSAEHADVLNEPGPYYNDFAIKSVIEAQINGDTLLSYSDSVAPWICWGPDFWADGINPRLLDSLRWICPGDMDTGEDGYFLDGSGQLKVADALLEFLTTEPTALPWIYGSNYPCFPDTSSGDDAVHYPDEDVLWIVQNPVDGILKFVIQLETNEKAEVGVYSLSGQEIKIGTYSKIEKDRVFTIPLTSYARGLYVLSVYVENKIYNRVFYLDN